MLEMSWGIRAEDPNNAASGVTPLWSPGVTQGWQTCVTSVLHHLWHAAATAFHSSYPSLVLISATKLRHFSIDQKRFSNLRPPFSHAACSLVRDFFIQLFGGKREISSVEMELDASQAPTSKFWLRDLEEDDARDMDFFLLPRMVIWPDENSLKKVIEYRYNDDGNRKAYNNAR
ncbi:hypothetical protein KSP40_PGU014248 [Platanthera guangdongensis]|uniref:Uncharacterized protein n=1 Tax=Platanthera guangdongensis TaxID=2320717 RepID=A0ABR2MTE3_9ASPA